jgi:hypothetical protein
MGSVQFRGEGSEGIRREYGQAVGGRAAAVRVAHRIAFAAALRWPLVAAADSMHYDPDDAYAGGLRLS